MHDIAKSSAVTPGLDPGVHDFRKQSAKPWMAGTSPAMTKLGIAATLQRHEGIKPCAS